MQRLLLAAALLLAGCGGSEEAVTTTVTVATTVNLTTTVEVTTTVAETTTVEGPSRGPGADPNDAEGQLDIERLAGVRAGDLLNVTLTTYEEWPATTLEGPAVGRTGANRLTLLFDTDLDGEPDFRGRVLYHPDAGLALWIRGQGQVQAFEPVPGTRVSQSSLEFTFPVDAMFLDQESEVDMQIAATSGYQGARDRVPDTGWLLVPYF